MHKILFLIRKHDDILAYLFFGILTTVVNYIVYLPCYNLLHISAAVSNAVAWVVAVAFAYMTNKPFVFKSYDWSAKTVVPELTKFVGSRVLSGALETAIIFADMTLMLTLLYIISQCTPQRCQIMKLSLEFACKT